MDKQSLSLSLSLSSVLHFHNVWSRLDFFAHPNCCLNSSKTNDFLDHEPQATVTKNLIHLAQSKYSSPRMTRMYIVSPKLGKFTWTPTKCSALFKITNILPLFLSFVSQDYHSDVDDVKTLVNSLKNHDIDKLLSQHKEAYAHLDFIFGENAEQVVYNPLVAFFKLQ
ncbi:unnamed protein product [Coffea canephora]|uniref:DH200=94 genomic scaffold, scaffold_1417 n=1 Tax=Coffea canephora TaxID=49390 RepID=A0A068VIH5_COFCA|nr:unnamed protein product [Coffea canephora]